MLTGNSHLSRKLLTAVGGSWALLVAVAVLGAYRYHDFIQHTNRFNSDAIEAVSLALQAQVHFKNQVMEWQQLLLTGEKTDFYDLHMGGIKMQYESTRAMVQQLLPLIVNNPDATRLGEKFLSAHYMLYVDYLEAIAVFNYYFERDDRSISSYKYAAGIDEEPSRLLDQLVLSVDAYRDIVLTEHNRQLRLLEFQLVALSALMFVLTVFGLFILLRNTVIRPLTLATRVARRISDGHFDTPIPPATGDESGQLLTALAVMQQNIQARTKDLRDLQAAIDAHAIVSMSDAEGRITYTNERFVAESGYDRAELIGQYHRLMKSGYHPPEFFTDLWDTITDGRVWHGEILNRRAGGELYWVDTTIYPVLGVDGVPDRYIAIRTDISSLKTVQRELTRARDAALRATLAKSAFLANMSHEIRTPMSGILGMLDLLADSTLTQDQHDMVAAARDSGQTLLSIINDILDLSKIEASRIELERIEFDLCELAESVCGLFSAKAYEKTLELICFVDPAAPARVISDPTRLKQILSNLIGNAIKFTETGAVSLSLRVAEGEDRAARLRLDVSDTGIGIPAEAQADIFAPFSQADASTTRRYGGTGLGLTISKKLVEAFGGELSLDSIPGRGSTFTLQIPVSIPDSTPAQSATTAPPLTGRVIWLITQNDRLEQPLTDYLRHWGAEIHCVRTLEALYADPAHEQSDAVLFDAGPQRRTPEEAAVVLNALERVAARTLILSPAGCPAARLAAARIAGCLSKPIRHAILLERLLQLFHEDIGTAVNTDAIDPAPATLPGTARILLAEDNRINQRVITAYLEAMGVKPRVVDNGVDAVAAALERPWDAILMDCQMPLMDGYTATREIRARCLERGLPRVPILALTANAMAGDRDLCLAAGMDDHLTKPVQRDQLHAVLSRWLHGAGAAGCAAPAAQDTDLRLDNPVEWRTLEALREVIGDEIVAIVQSFFQSAERNMTDILDAVFVGDIQRIHPPAHNLKATAGTLGATRLQQTAQALETCARAGVCVDLQGLVDDLKESYLRTQQALTDWLARQPGRSGHGTAQERPTTAD